MKLPRLSTAIIEFVHAANRLRAHAQMTWSSFAALHTNQELATISATCRKFNEPRRKPQQVVIAPALGPRKASSAYQCFRTMCFKRDVHQGVAFTAAHHESIQQQWLSMSLEDQAPYFALSESTKDQAAYARYHQQALQAGRTLTFSSLRTYFLFALYLLSLRFVLTFSSFRTYFLFVSYLLSLRFVLTFSSFRTYFLFVSYLLSLRLVFTF